MHHAQHRPCRPASHRAAPHDYLVLADMKDCLRRHLNAALIECAALAGDLGHIDADVLMPRIRAEFDPSLANARIQDCFSDGFYEALNTLRDLGGEPITAHRAVLPSGVACGDVSSER